MTMVIMNMEFRDEKQIINLSAPKAESLNATLYDRYLELKRDLISLRLLLPEQQKMCLQFVKFLKSTTVR